MGFFKQLRLLLWKNLLNQKRQVVWTIFELLIPLSFTAIFVGMRQTVNSAEIPVTNYEPYHVTGTWLDFYQTINNYSMVNHVLIDENEYNGTNFCVQFDPKNIFYAPKTNLTDSLMKLVGLRTNMEVTGKAHRVGACRKLDMFLFQGFKMKVPWSMN